MNLPNLPSGRVFTFPASNKSSRNVLKNVLLSCFAKLESAKEFSLT